jgi:hypothetical protein
MEPEYYAPPTSVMNEWRKQCSCDERYRPCDGVMAGGMCDDMHDDEDYEQHEEFEET